MNFKSEDSLQLVVFLHVRFEESGSFQQVLHRALVDRFSQEVIHAGVLGEAFVLLSRVGSDTANEGLFGLGKVLVEELLDLHRGLDTVALRHAEVEHDEFVGATLAPIPLLNPEDCLVSIRGGVTLNVELHEEVLDCHRVEGVVVNYEHLGLRIAIVLLVGHDLGQVLRRHPCVFMELEATGIRFLLLSSRP